MNCFSISIETVRPWDVILVVLFGSIRLLIHTSTRRRAPLDSSSRGLLALLHRLFAVKTSVVLLYLHSSSLQRRREKQKKNIRREAGRQAHALKSSVLLGGVATVRKEKYGSRASAAKMKTRRGKKRTGAIERDGAEARGWNHGWGFGSDGGFEVSVFHVAGELIRERDSPAVPPPTKRGWEGGLPVPVPLGSVVEQPGSHGTGSWSWSWSWRALVVNIRS